MSPKKDSGPSYDDFIREVLREANGPVLLDHLVKEVLSRHPTTAKNPRSAVVSKLRWMEGLSIVRPDADHILPIHIAYQGARIRIRMDREMVDQAAIPFMDYFQNFFPDSYDRSIPHEALRFEDIQGKRLEAQFKTVQRQLKNPLFGSGNYDQEMLVLKDWFHSQKMYHKDHLLVTVVDWEQGIFRLEREPASAVNQTLLAERNRQFGEILYHRLESSRSEDLMVHAAIPTVYALLPDKSGYPPDHWSVILEQDKRMVTDGFRIHDSDSGFSMLETAMRQATGQGRMVAPTKPVKEKGEGEKVYRFRAELKYRPGIWREVEIQGKQPLGTLDRFLRHAFQHDSSDHLSGFWKLVARKGEKSTRYREVEVATVEPFGGGEGSGTSIDELDLHMNDRLKYVYDFGDWVEHVLTLKAIVEPEKKTIYPREIARNTPKIRYCTDCEEEGKKVAAKWACVTCSNELGVETLLCDEHAGDEEHEEHYTVEILS